MLRALLLVAFALLSCAAPQGEVQLARKPSMIRYTVSLPERQAQRVHVRMEIPGVPGEHLDIAMPVWTPGSYLVREFARNVLDLRAVDGSGAALRTEKLDKNTWRVHHAGADTVAVDYSVYSNERSVRTNHVDADHAFLSTAATFFFLRGAQDVPHVVAVDAPAGWRVFTGLASDGDAWRAADYDELVDCPIEIGPHERLTFEHAGVPHHVVLAGEVELDREQVLEDHRKIVAEVASVFGTMPFDEYTFIHLIVDSGGGGLEHRNSSVCMGNRWRLGTKKGWRSFLGLVAHEYFHAWNVKRFRPAALGPFDFDTENYTTDLWVAEGITSYVDDLSVARAGFVDKIEDYLKDRAGDFKSHAERPGGKRMSLTAASHDAWIKGYRPDENSINSSVSYYSKGALVALMLDLRIRRVSAGRATLFDAMKLGWERYTARGEGYPDGAMATLSAEVAGADLSGFFADYVDGTAPLDPAEDFAWVGLELKVTPSKSDRKLPEDADGFKLAPDLGLKTSNSSGLCKITAVLEDGPAYRAGLNVDDLLLAVNGHRVAHDTLTDRLDRNGTGPAEIHYFRGQELRTATITPDARRLETWKLVPLAEASAAQQAAFEAWTGWSLPGTGDGNGDADDEGADDRGEDAGES